MGNAEDNAIQMRSLPPSGSNPIDFDQLELDLSAASEPQLVKLPPKPPRMNILKQILQVDIHLIFKSTHHDGSYLEFCMYW